MMPGMAAGPQIFEYIKLPDIYDIYYLQWQMPQPDESLKSYVNRLIKTQIHHTNPILLGVSFGGIIIQEMARQLSVKQLILISTIKNSGELSPFLKNIGRYRLYKLIPLSLLNHLDILEKIAQTSRAKLKIKLYRKYMNINNPVYLRWSIEQILNWQSDKIKKPYVHIVGEYDRVFPEKYITDPKIIVPEGRHDMIIFKAKWFNNYLPKLMQK